MEKPPSFVTHEKIGKVYKSKKLSYELKQSSRLGLGEALWLNKSLDSLEHKRIIHYFSVYRREEDFL